MAYYPQFPMMPYAAAQPSQQQAPQPSFSFGPPPSSYLDTHSSLVYTIKDKKAITFDEFLVAVKHLHSFKVISIDPDIETNSITVNLGYNCSMKNVRAKLGRLPVSVVKLNPQLKPSELGTLQSLCNKFGFGGEIEEEADPVPEPPKKRTNKGVPKPAVQVQGEEY